MNEEPIFKPYGFKKEKLLELMMEYGLKGILLTSSENIYYTTCYTVLPSSGNPILYTLRNRLPYFVYVDENGLVTLFCWGYSTQGVQFGVDRIKGYASYEEALQTLEGHLKEELIDGSTLGIESGCPYFITQLIEEKLDHSSLFVVDAIMSRLRLIKSAEELNLVRKSVEIIETTLAELYPSIRIGMSRLELMQEAKTLLFRNGASGISHLTFSFGQANPEIAIGERLEPDRLITLDLGGIYKGYASDNRRYAYTGDIPPTLLDRYEAMVEIVDSVGNKLIPGTKYAEVFQHALDMYHKFDIEPGKELNHVGHNIGLETEEEWITNDPELEVQAGMVINVELYSAAPSGEYVGDEETYIIETGGPTRISVLPREIRVIN